VADLTLLERIEAADDGRPVPAGRQDPSVLADSILTSLTRVLNSRGGCAETRVEYGLPDFNDYVNRLPDAVPAIGRAVKDQIESFEPRLSNVEVHHVDDPDHPLSLCFHIEAVFHLNGKRHRIGLNTVVADDGFVYVRG